MARLLQIQNNVALNEWNGSGAVPIPPDDSWTFIDVTDRPEAQCGHLYDADTDTFTPTDPPVIEPQVDRLATLEDKVSQILTHVQALDPTMILTPEPVVMKTA